MSIKSGQRVVAQSLNDRTEWDQGTVISVNGPNLWVMLDSGKQVLRWEHELTKRDEGTNLDKDKQNE